MGFLDKLRASMARFMSGRYGADQLSMAMVIAALVVSILGTFTGARAVAMVLSDALLIVAFFRMLSKDRYRRERHSRRAGPPRRQGAQIRPLLLRRILPRAARRGQRDRHLQKLRRKI